MALVLKGGRLVDPGRGIDACLEIRIENGKIAAIGSEVATVDAEVRDLGGAIVTPGLIDGHVHVYQGFGFHGIDPDVIGVGSGVTTVVDAGSAGAATFEGLSRYVLSGARTRVLAFLHLALVGTPGGPSVSELSDPKSIDEEATERVIEANREIIVGLKGRASRTAVGKLGLEPIRRGRALADRVKLPLMVHIGDPHPNSDPPILIRDLVKLLRPGDIVTHLFTGHPGGLLDGNGRLHPEVREAHAAGLRFDVGHGLNNVSFDTAARVLDQGLKPHTISTDGHRLVRTRLVYDLPTTMAKCLALGFSLGEVIEKATYEAARSLGRPELVPGLAVGQPAEISVLRIEDAEWEAEDSMGKKMKATRKIMPLLAIRGAEVFEPVAANRP